MSSPPKNDAWRPYADVRFVLVGREGRTLKPYRAIVLADKVMDNRRWLQLAMWIDDGHPHPHFRIDWVLRSKCWPVHVDPNEYRAG